ncbi:MAG: Neutral metalloprotease precursor [bacterium ADurb.Bin157]|nr:MAG: Neutral metalloprotease precursor [bacterium ADurb.Bin157]
MKNLSFKLLLICIFFNIAQINYAQTTADGTFRLRQTAEKSIKINSNTKAANFLRASAILSELKPLISKVGFQVFNFENKNYEYKEGLFLKQGQFCKIFVEQEAIDKLKKAPLTYASEVSKNFDEIIYPLVAKWFGTPQIPTELNLPDNDIYIFLTTIKGQFSEGYVAGYFDHRDLETKTGNRKPVLFMNLTGNESDNTNLKTNAFYRTLVHEFQHLTNYTLRKALNMPEQERWLDEGYSMFAEYIYSGCVGDDTKKIPPAPHLEKYLNEPNIDIVNNSETAWFKEPDLYKQYGGSFMFVAYLVEKYGGDSDILQQFFLKELVKKRDPGIAGIEHMLICLDKSFSNLLFDFNLALTVDDPCANNGLWCFRNKLESFGESGKLIPIGNIKGMQTDKICVLPSSFKDLSDIGTEYSAYMVQPIEIPVFEGQNIVVLKPKEQSIEP